MTTTQLRLPVTAPTRATFAVAEFAKSLFRNVLVVANVLIHARSVTANVQKMADMLREADRLERTAPARAADLRSAARQLFLV
jgi:L-lysine 2,3-aminomutase